MDVSYTLSDRRPLQIGLVVLQADETIEADMRRLIPSVADLLISRVPSGRHVTSETLSDMESVLTEAAARFPESAQFSAVGYGCTSGTAQIGAARIDKLLRAGTHTQAVTEPVSALLAACRQMGLRRIGLISPYVESVSATLRGVLGKAGIEIVGIASFNQSEESKVARISPQSVYGAACTLAAEIECDAVFLSCTNLRTLDVIDLIEKKIDRPVLSSNQVLAWHLGRLAGIESPTDAPGSLWRRTVS